MKITVKAHPSSKFEKIIEHEGIYHAYFNVLPSGGRANQKIIEMISDYFNVPKSKIEIIFGKTSSEKIISCPDAAFIINQRESGPRLS